MRQCKAFLYISLVILNKNPNFSFQWVDTLVSYFCEGQCVLKLYEKLQG